MIYINGMYNGQRETIDQFKTRIEALRMLSEYRLAFGYGWSLWLSTRCCANWK